jgi:uncharacterized protein
VTGVSDIRTRLRRALGDALKARDASTVSALRSALSAIGNAEAVDPGPARPTGTGSAHFAGTVLGLGAGEAERRHLTEADAAAIVRTEAAEREAAASEYERGGHALVREPDDEGAFPERTGRPSSWPVNRQLGRGHLLSRRRVLRGGQMQRQLAALYLQLCQPCPRAGR